MVPTPPANDFGFITGAHIVAINDTVDDVAIELLRSSYAAQTRVARLAGLPWESEKKFVLP
jgi:hypothetical protein